MSNRLPDIIKPLHLAETRQILSGYLALERMSRLVPSLHAPRGVVEVGLEFGIDEQKVHYIKGWLQTTLSLSCQRCFQSMPFPVNAEIALGMVRTEEEADLLPASYEPLLVKEPAISLLDMMEDELILSLPLVIRHKENECHVEQDVGAAPVQYTHAPDENQNPFAVLEQLKKPGKLNTKE